MLWIAWAAALLQLEKRNREATGAGDAPATRGSASVTERGREGERNVQGV